MADLQPLKHVSGYDTLSSWRSQKRHQTSNTTNTSFGTPATSRTSASTNCNWLPSTGNDPYLRMQKAAEKQNLVKIDLEAKNNVVIGQELDQLEGNLPAQKLLEKEANFWTYESDLNGSSRSSFRTNPTASASRPTFVDRYFNHKPSLAALKTVLFRNGDPMEFASASGWTNWPSPEETPDFQESVITSAFVRFLNTIINRLGLSATRVAVDRQRFGITTYDGHFLKPDCFAWANDPGPYPPMDGVPPAVTKGKMDARVKSEPEEPSDLPDEKPPLVKWPWCLFPIEIKTEARRNPATDYLQLGTYVREVFVAQPNRRFVPSLLLTESHFDFLLWDRAGVVVSERVKYIENFDVFCLMLSSLLVWKPEQVGFDTTAFYPNTSSRDSPLMTIKTEVEAHDAQDQEIIAQRVGEYQTDSKATDRRAENVTQHNSQTVLKTEFYEVDELIVRSYTLRGRATTCWRVHKQGNPHDHYLILDSWVEGGSSKERAIFQAIENARVEGMIEIVALYDVLLSERHHVANIDNVAVPYPDDTRHIRLGDDFTKNNVNLVHTRTVLHCDAVPLGQWSNPWELLTALRDAIIVHGRIYNLAKILQRDIVPWNVVIVLKPPGPPGATPGAEFLRGGLIDFTCATSVASGQPAPRVERTPASRWYMSHFSLKNTSETGTYLDDLESFYWILFSLLEVGIVGTKSSTGRKKKKIKETEKPIKRKTTLSTRMDSIALAAKEPDAADSKAGHFYLPLVLGEVDAVLKPIARLVTDLHDFIRDRIVSFTTNGAQHLTPEVDYQKFVALFDSAILLTCLPSLPLTNRSRRQVGRQAPGKR